MIGEMKKNKETNSLSTTNPTNDTQTFLDRNFTYKKVLGETIHLKDIYTLFQNLTPNTKQTIHNFKAMLTKLGVKRKKGQQDNYFMIPKTNKKVRCDTNTFPTKEKLNKVI